MTTESKEVKLKGKKSNKVGKKTKQKEVDAKNLENTKKKITKEKDLMYIYGAEQADLASRKTFRHGIRRKLASFQKSIAKASKEEKPALIAEATAWAKGVYTPNHMPKF